MRVNVAAVTRKLVSLDTCLLVLLCCEVLSDWDIQSRTILPTNICRNISFAVKHPTPISIVLRTAAMASSIAHPVICEHQYRLGVSRRRCVQMAVLNQIRKFHLVPLTLDIAGYVVPYLQPILCDAD